jgi:hypothetical protein
VSWGSLIFSTGLTDTSGTITSNLSTGVSGGQSVVGGTASGNNLTLSSTSHATKGKIIFGTSAYDEVNNWLGIGTVTPSTKLHVLGTTEQMRLGYDASNYLSTTISSIGGVTNTITSSSGLPVFTFNKDLLVNGITVGKGKNSLSANTILGESTGASITIGNNNTMLGYNAGGANTEGSSNVFIGDSTGSYNTTGVGNTVMGSGAGVTGATNGYSVIIGLNAGYKSSSNYNVIVGFQAGAELTTGAHNNTYIGTRAGQNNLGQYNTTLGFYTGNDLTGGDTNTLIGYNTGLGIITGDKNTIIGANVTGLSAALSNNIILADGDGNRRINVNSSGYVGIGTTGQTAQLEVQANTGTGTPLVAIWGRGSGWASDIGVKGTGYQTGVYGEAAVGVWGHGPIGVYGTSSAASNVGVKGVGSNRGGEIGVYGYNGKWAGLFETSNAPEGSGASVVKILSSYSGNSDPALIVEHDGTGDLVQVFKNSTQHFTIANSGNVGLGVTAPTAYKLQIKHDANRYKNRKCNIRYSFVGGY